MLRVSCEGSLSVMHYTQTLLGDGLQQSLEHRATGMASRISQMEQRMSTLAAESAHKQLTIEQLESRCHVRVT
jgi:hypothetical protein